MLYQTKEPLPTTTEAPLQYNQEAQWTPGTAAGLASAQRRESVVESSFMELDSKIKYLCDRVAVLSQRLSPIIVAIPSDRPIGSAKEPQRQQSALSQGILEAAKAIETEAQKIDNILSSLTI